MRVLVADADEPFRETLLAHLQDGGHPAQAVDDPSALATVADAFGPEVVVASAGPDGRRVLPLVRGAFPGVLAVVVEPADPQAVREAVRFGARGCLLRSDPVDQVVAGLRAMVDGGVHASPALSSTLWGLLTRRPTGAGTTLTAREVEVLDQAARGHSNREIAEVLGIAENTVKNHLRNILEKLHLHSRLEAVLHAVRHGLISLE